MASKDSKFGPQVNLIPEAELVANFTRARSPLVRVWRPCIAGSFGRSLVSMTNPLGTTTQIETSSWKLEILLTDQKIKEGYRFSRSRHHHLKFSASEPQTIISNYPIWVTGSQYDWNLGKHLDWNARLVWQPNVTTTDLVPFSCPDGLSLFDSYGTQVGNCPRSWRHGQFMNTGMIGNSRQSFKMYSRWAINSPRVGWFGVLVQQLMGKVLSIIKKCRW